MNLILSRDTFTEKSTSGLLYIDGEIRPECCTLELPNVDGKPGSCIPQGTYSVILSHSPKFSGDRTFDELTARLGVLPLMPEIKGIPGRSEIRMHWGNEPENTDGCILIGTTRSEDFISGSREAFASFYARLIIGEATGPITIQVLGGAT